MSLCTSQRLTHKSLTPLPMINKVLGYIDTHGAAEGRIEQLILQNCGGILLQICIEISGVHTNTTVLVYDVPTAKIDENNSFDDMEKVPEEDTHEKIY